MSACLSMSTRLSINTHPPTITHPSASTRYSRSLVHQLAHDYSPEHVFYEKSFYHEHSLTHEQKSTDERTGLQKHKLIQKSYNRQTFTCCIPFKCFVDAIKKQLMAWRLRSFTQYTADNRQTTLQLAIVKGTQLTDGDIRVLLIEILSRGPRIAFDLVKQFHSLIIFSQIPLQDNKFKLLFSTWR